jgi:hypothetical protein
VSTFSPGAPSALNLSAGGSGVAMVDDCAAAAAFDVAIDPDEAGPDPD